MAANAVSSLNVMEAKGSKQAIIFSSFLLAFSCLDCIPYMEMYFLAKEDNVRQAARLTLFGRLTCIVVSSASIISSVHAPLYVTCILWIIFGNLLRVFILYLSIFKVQSKKTSVPMHGEFVSKKLVQNNRLTF